jgi:rhamnose transport system ATP-binding protein
VTTLLRASAITKSYAGARALDGVTFDLRAGEVHALVGENGAGKSTLIKIVTGAVERDTGSIEVCGQAIPHHDPHTARALGIAAIYQHPSLFPHLTVAENIALAVERGGSWRRIDWAGRRRSAAQVLARIGASIDPDRTVETLSMPEQQIVEIAKAVGAEARIVIMDEPTASLTDREVERLFGVITRLREQGVGIVYISHRLEEVFAVANRITVLRDGRTVATSDAADVTMAQVIRLMVGRDVDAVFPKVSVAAGDVALELRAVGHRASGLRDVSLSVRRGEIVGLAGLVGSGRTELAEVVFGLRPADAGSIHIDGAPASLGTPSEAIAHGVAYVPEDRPRHGVVLELPIAANTTLASLPDVSRRGLIDRASEHAVASAFIDQLRIKASSTDAEAASLSGGNQQKVALARWLATKPRILILDEPTQGVDVGSKAEIHAIMGTLASQGMAILMISSELPEILGMSDRVAVMHGGTIRGVLDRGDATEHRILELALGHA